MEALRALRLRVRRALLCRHRLRRIHWHESQIVHEQADVHIGEAEPIFFAEAALDIGQLQAFGQPCGDFLFLLVGKLHSVIGLIRALGGKRRMQQC